MEMIQFAVASAESFALAHNTDVLIALVAVVIILAAIDFIFRASASRRLKRLTKRVDDLENELKESRVYESRKLIAEIKRAS